MHNVYLRHHGSWSRMYRGPNNANICRMHHGMIQIFWRNMADFDQQSKLLYVFNMHFHPGREYLQLDSCEYSLTSFQGRQASTLVWRDDFTKVSCSCWKCNQWLLLYPSVKKPILIDGLSIQKCVLMPPWDCHYGSTHSHWGRDSGLGAVVACYIAQYRHTDCVRGLQGSKSA